MVKQFLVNQLMSIVVDSNESRCMSKEVRFIKLHMSAQNVHVMVNNLIEYIYS